MCLSSSVSRSETSLAPRSSSTDASPSSGSRLPALRASSPSPASTRLALCLSHRQCILRSSSRIPRRIRPKIVVRVAHSSPPMLPLSHLGRAPVNVNTLRSTPSARRASSPPIEMRLWIPTQTALRRGVNEGNRAERRAGVSEPAGGGRINQSLCEGSGSRPRRR
ncbi:hypothetical protein B0H13DRAFT_442008 [Mycena leptocephala]|nr:hypothetical protein B0H13DRAFT_442008 [Mycena leptocephala]